MPAQQPKQVGLGIHSLAADIAPDSGWRAA
jgi:hypothetical protein